jgi:hypothetical protein
MDIAALGAAATQVSGAQRQQQASLSGIKSAQVQAQSLISMLTAATSQPPQTQAAAQPVNASVAATDGAGADRRLPRGSILNILA